MLKSVQAFLFSVFSFFFGVAHAAGPDMSALTGAVDFGTVTVAILAIAGLLAVVYVAVKGAQIGLRMIRGG